MVEKTFELRAWEKNSRAVIFAVQGEALSRTVTVKLLDSGGQPIDLTLSTARLYVIKPDGTKIYVTGTTIDMQNGIVSFLLDSQAATSAGTAQCYVVVTQADGGTLIFAGMTLIIAPASIDGSVQSTNEFTALQDALRIVQDIDNRIPKTEKGAPGGVQIQTAARNVMVKADASGNLVAATSGTDYGIRLSTLWTGHQSAATTLSLNDSVSNYKIIIIVTSYASPNVQLKHNNVFVALWEAGMNASYQMLHYGNPGVAGTGVTLGVGSDYTKIGITQATASGYEVCMVLGIK